MVIQATTAIKMTKATMKRLKGFDYKKPYFYMVTLKRRKGLRPFCEITKVKEPPKDGPRQGSLFDVTPGGKGEA